MTFYSVAEMRQHNEGPTHRKAVAKDQALRERNARLGAQASAASEAVVRTLLLLCIGALENPCPQGSRVVDLLMGRPDMQHCSSASNGESPV